jgi:hypothetical protein
MVGTADTLRDADLRVTPRADAQGRNRYERADYMYARGLAVDPASRWQRIDVPGVGHAAEPMAEAAQAFLQATTLAAPVPEERAGFLRVSPNPVSAGTVLQGSGWTGGSRVEIGVYDLAGRRVAAGSVLAVDGSWQVAWRSLTDGGRIRPGVYFVRARDRERQAQRKVWVPD